MVRGFNKVIIVGNLTRDPEIRYTNSNRALARFSVAVNRTWKDKEGNVQEQADYIPVVVWGPQAENCEKFLSKGRPVLVEGRIQTRSYEAQDGSKRYVTEVQAENVVFLGGGEKRESSGSRRPEEPHRGGRFPEEPFNGSSRMGGDPFPMDLSEDGEDQADIPF